MSETAATRPPLPIDAVLPNLLAALDTHTSCVLVAEPGAGKTTVVPLALLDATWRGDGRIIVLEPRRLAARAAAARMASLLGEEVGGRVGLRVRLETKVSARTRIEVVTEGVFTRMILEDPELSGIACILFDEFHERSLDGDLGLALALDAQGALREDLRILPMSATIDAAGVASHLGGAPVSPLQRPQLSGRDPLSRARRRPGHRSSSGKCGGARRWPKRPARSSPSCPGQGEIRRAVDMLGPQLPADTDLAPLYGALTGAEQNAAIRPAANGRRKVVLATSIAQTSLTIDGRARRHRQRPRPRAGP